MKFKFFFLVLLFSQCWFYAQDDLLSEIDTLKSESVIQPGFKALQVVTGQSTKMPAKKEFYFLVAHRFGDVSLGLKNFFGLDNATTKLGGIYGISDGIALNFARHTYQKTFEFGIKYRVLQENKDANTPVDIVLYHTADINTQLSKDTYPNLQFSDRLAFLSQALISKKINEALTLQLSPSFVHKKLYDPAIESNNIFLMGIGGRYKISRRVSINAEYFPRFDQKKFYKNALSVGADIDTGGHIFQLLFSNSQPTTDIGYLTNAYGNWTKGQIYFGFNLYRVF